MVHIEAPPATASLGAFLRRLMTDAIVFKYATERELERLGACFSVADCKRALGDIFGGRDHARDAESDGFLLDLQFHTYSYPLDPTYFPFMFTAVEDSACYCENYTFCREQLFSIAQTSALLGICHSLMERDLSAGSSTTMSDSYARFEALLLAHSVDRSPKSVMVFSPEQAAAIVDFVTHTYFRHFELYKSVFTPFRREFLVQKEVNGVQTPRAPRPLSDGILHVAPAVESPVNMKDESATSNP